MGPYDALTKEKNMLPRSLSLWSAISSQLSRAKWIGPKHSKIGSA
jgi:hypothetical protein